MQQSWRQDADKLTFISCLPLQEPGQPLTAGQHDAPDRMLGDVNLFLTTSESDSGIDIIGEVELMIARDKDQGKGSGKSSLVAFLTYIVHHESDILQEYCAKATMHSEEPNSISYLRVKIGESNSRSIHLFESFGFKKVGESPNYFGEFELRLQSPLAQRTTYWKSKLGMASYQELTTEETRNSAELDGMVS